MTSNIKKITPLFAAARPCCIYHIFKECRARGQCECLDDVCKLLLDFPEKQQLRHLYIDRDTISFNFNRIGI